MVESSDAAKVLRDPMETIAKGETVEIERTSGAQPLARVAPPALLSNHSLIEDALRTAIGTDPADLFGAMRYVMGWEGADGRPSTATGKRIRPTLCLFAAEAAGGTPTEALPAAVAVELVHNFSLVHDEIQDHDAERHHRPTLWARLGEAQSINVGDGLYAIAIRALTSGPGPAERRIAALDVLTNAVQRMIMGQWNDILFESRDDVTVDEYLAMSAGKTGALLGAPLEMGALLAGARVDVAHRFGLWGQQVGLAFQAQDDYLGIWGDSLKTGKSSTNDIARKKKTLPVVFGLLSADHAPTIRRVYALGAPGEDEIREVAHALTLAGADEICRGDARRHAEAADALLDELPVTAETRLAFRSIADYMVDRTF